MGSLCTSSGTHLEDTTNTYSSNDYNYSNDSGPKFKDVTEIFDKDGRCYNQCSFACDSDLNNIQQMTNSA